MDISIVPLDSYRYKNSTIHQRRALVDGSPYIVPGQESPKIFRHQIMDNYPDIAQVLENWELEIVQEIQEKLGATNEQL